MRFLHENAAPSRGSSMQRKDGNLSKRASSRESADRMKSAACRIGLKLSPQSYRIATLMAGSPQSADIPESRCMFMLGRQHASHPTPHRPLFPGLPRPAACEDGKAIGRMYDDRRGREQKSPTAWSAPSNPISLTKHIQPPSDRARADLLPLHRAYIYSLATVGALVG
jgi:hypothetical protein